MNHAIHILETELEGLEIRLAVVNKYYLPAEHHRDYAKCKQRRLPLETKIEEIKNAIKILNGK